MWWCQSRNDGWEFVFFPCKFCTFSLSFFHIPFLLLLYFCSLPDYTWPMISQRQKERKSWIFESKTNVATGSSNTYSTGVCCLELSLVHFKTLGRFVQFKIDYCDLQLSVTQPRMTFASYGCEICPDFRHILRTDRRTDGRVDGECPTPSFGHLCLFQSNMQQVFGRSWEEYIYAESDGKRKTEQKSSEPFFALNQNQLGRHRYLPEWAILFAGCY